MTKQYLVIYQLTTDNKTNYNAAFEATVGRTAKESAINIYNQLIYYHNSSYKTIVNDVSEIIPLSITPLN